MHNIISYKSCVLFSLSEQEFCCVADTDDAISKTELRLTDIARELQGDWVLLAKQLGFTDEEIAKILRDHPGNEEEQALVMLHEWVDKNRPNATGMNLPCNIVITQCIIIFLCLCPLHSTWK